MTKLKKRPRGNPRTTVYTITAADIRKRFRLPDDAEIVVCVPGGGDWSNTDLSIKAKIFALFQEAMKP